MSTLKKWKIDNLELSYDSLVDSYYIRYQEGEFSHNVELAEWIVADVNTDGEILGIEFLGISKKINLPGPFTKKVARMVPVHLLPFLTAYSRATG